MNSKPVIVDVKTPYGVKLTAHLEIDKTFENCVLLQIIEHPAIVGEGRTISEAFSMLLTVLDEVLVLDLENALSDIPLLYNGQKKEFYLMNI